MSEIYFKVLKAHKKYFNLLFKQKETRIRAISPEAWNGEKKKMSRPPSYTGFRASSAKSFNQAVNLENL